MLPFQVRRFSARTGVEVAVLLDRGALPRFWPNVFVTDAYRMAARSVNTAEKVLRSLGMANMWATARGRDLDHDLSVGSFVSLADIEELAGFLRLSAADQEAWVARAKRSAQPERKVVHLEDVRPDHRRLTEPGHREVTAVDASARIRWTADYIDWHLKRRLGSLERRRAESEDLKQVGALVVGRLRQLAPREARESDDDEDLEGVSMEVVIAVEAALQPDAEGNPFTPGFIQARNYLLWRLLLDTGARRGEVHGAKVDDVRFSTRRFQIRVTKTIPRTVPINARTAAAFDRLIEQFWAHLPQEARRRGYLFTDCRGRRLSLRAFNRMFERVREKVLGTPDFMAPHTVRRTWNDQFSALVDAAPPGKRYGSDEEVKTRNRLQGWSGESSMGARYARRHIRRKADKIAEELTENLVRSEKTD